MKVTGGPRRKQGHRRRVGAARWGLVLAAIGVVAMLGVLGALLASRPSRNGDASTPQLPQAPDFRLAVYQGEADLGGKDLTLAQIVGQGKPVVLNFWAGLCPPCRAEMPGFQAVYQERRSEFVLLGVDVGPFTGLGSRQEGADLVQKLGVTYPIADVPDGRAVQLYRVTSMPTTVFITGDGRVYRKVSGAISARELNSFVNELLLQAAKAAPAL